ncbi:DUF1707 domain-containing protein [Actinomycetes bacterium KLBMP 9759]
MSDVDHGVMRASEADRAAVAERLRLAVDEGRLGLTEYDERLRAAYASATYGELERVTADLPALRPEQHPSAKAEKAAAERKEWYDEWRSWLGGAVIMLAIWGGSSLASGELQAFWPAIPLAIWAAILIASAIGGGGESGKKA